MLSYLHGFHAGGFPDVHKHTALCFVLAHLLAKEAPFRVIDTHAGRGRYDLTAAEAGKTGEWREGIGRIPLRDEPGDRIESKALRRYRDTVAAFNPSGDLTVYPGSPAIAARLLRAGDRLALMELHPAEHKALAALFRRDGRVHIHRRDGFEGLPALVPPPERRGLVLIDPSYEVKTDYAALPACLGRALRRWPQGIYMIWYPMLPDARHRPMVEAIEALGRETLVAGLLTGAVRERGLTGTGVVVINPPFRFAEAFDAAGREMARRLFPDGRARHDCRLVPAR
jgi:23S rRNA (adenine2030-N6)-methyltransferase